MAKRNSTATKKAATSKRPIARGEEQTKAQVATSFGQVLSNPLPAAYSTYREMRKHPTVALARAVIVALIQSGRWAVQTGEDIDPKEAEEITGFLEDVYIPPREQILEDALYGAIDFGYEGFEQVYETGDDGRIRVTKFKALYHDTLNILVDRDTGAFAGYRQGNTDYEAKYLLHIPFRVEGTQWHGQALLEDARRYYNDWVEANNGAARYDRKIAGSHWVIHYPIGKSLVSGTLTDNFEIAGTILEALESSGTIRVPNSVSAAVEELSNANPAWQIELISDEGGRQPLFIDRLKYLDAMLVRALHIPERAIIEGEFGTKAEAGVHAGIAVTMLEAMERNVVRYLNWHSVDRLLAWNWGEAYRGTAWIEPAPLVDASLGFLRDLYAAIVAHPTLGMEEVPRIDLDAVKDHLNIPKEANPEDRPAGETPDAGLTLEQREAMRGRTPAGVKEG